MDFFELLKFAPLIAGFAFLGFLLFKGSLKDFKLGTLITYFIGVLIAFIAVGWFVDSFLISWANTRLENADTSAEFQELKERSERIIDNSFNDEAGTTIVQPQPTTVQVQIVVTATPIPGTNDPTLRPETGPTQHTVVAGDTLFGIAQQFNTSVNDIMIVNGLTSHTIIPGQVLNIPAPSQ